MFQEKFLQLWDEKVTEQTAVLPGFKEGYLDSIVEDSAAVTGLELCRRIIGITHVKDITTITNAKDRVLAEKICLTAGKIFIQNRSTFRNGTDFTNVLRESVRLFKEGAISHDNTGRSGAIRAAR